MAAESPVRRVAILVKRFPRLSETFVLHEFLELRRQGLPVSLVAVLDPHEVNIQEEAGSLRGEVHYLRTGSGPLAWAGLLPDFFRTAVRHAGGTLDAIRFAVARRSLATLRHLLEAARLVRWMERENVVHLHAHFAHGPAAIADLARRISGVPFSFTAHAKDLYTTPPAHVAARCRTATFVVTCTGSNGDYLRSLADPRVSPRIHVLPHGVDLVRFSREGRRPVSGRILSIGRLVPKKGFDLLLAALRLVRAARLDFECRIFGDGPLRGDLRDLADRHELAAEVSFPGARPQSELLREFSEAEIFVLCPVMTADGDRDGVPNVLIEAMAAGVPVVASNISGIPELIEDGKTGLLVPPDAAHLARAIESLLRSPSLRAALGQAGRAFVVENRALDRCVRPLASLLADRVGERSGTSDR